MEDSPLIPHSGSKSPRYSDLDLTKGENLQPLPKSSGTKNIGSLIDDIEISGCRSRYLCRLVVPHLAAPITKKVGILSESTGVTLGEDPRRAIAILPSGLIQIKTFKQTTNDIKHRVGVKRPEHPIRRFVRRTGMVRLHKLRQHSGLRPEDAFIDSFPRSGNTWTRFVLTDLLRTEGGEFLEVQATIPRVGSHDPAPSILPGGGRLLKTHEQYRPVYGRTVLLIRDPRDMALSYRRFLSAYGHEYADLGEFVRDLVRGRIGTNGSWLDHTTSWLTARDQGAVVHLVLYEQLRASPEEYFSEIARFLGIEAPGDRFSEAVRRNTVEAMRVKESELGRAVGGKSWNPSVSFIGKAEVGGWQGQFTEEQLELLAPSVRLYESIAREISAAPVRMSPDKSSQQP